MSDAETTEAETEPTSNGAAVLEDWPVAREAADDLGITVATLRGHVRRGRIDAYHDKRGRHRFDPAEIHLLAEHLGANDEARDAPPVDEGEIGPMALMASMVKFSQVQTAHVESLMSTIVPGLKEIQKRYHLTGK